MKLMVGASLISEVDALALAEEFDTCAFMAHAARLRDNGHGNVITYSRKIFVPLTHLCRDNCHYCTFAKPPRKGERIYMSSEDVLAIVRKGRRRVAPRRCLRSATNQNCVTPRRVRT